MNENMMELRGKLFKKLAKISHLIGQIKKDGKNTFDKWEFISADKMMASCRDIFDEQGVYLISSIIPELTEHVESGKTSNGSIIFKTTVTMQFSWVDCDTGYQSDPILFSGQDQDRAKSYAQAVTDCHKRFLFKAFNVSSAADKDPDSQTIDIAKTIQSEKAEIKRKFKDLYVSSKLDKPTKDPIIAAMKLQHGEDVTKWSEAARKELETKLTAAPEKKTEKPAKKTKSLDEIMENGVDIELDGSKE